MATSRRPKHVSRTPQPTLTIEQIDRIATANAEQHLHITGAVVRILAETGLLSSELCRLPADDIDVNNNCLFIFGEKTALRIVPLTPRALHALQYLHSHFLGSELVMGHNPVHTLCRVSKNFQEIATRQGIVVQGLYSLRRFCVKRLLRGGADLITVARSMGHSYQYPPILRRLQQDDLIER